MTKSVLIYLGKETLTQDEYGVMHKEFTWTPVFAKVSSVSASEFFNGGQNGLKPDLRFIVFTYDYFDERIVNYDGTLYTVYRTYVDGDRTELYTERRIGDE